MKSFVLGAVVVLALVTALGGAYALGRNSAEKTPTEQAVAATATSLPPTMIPQPTATPQPPTPTPEILPVILADRTNCGEIRASDYRSQTERVWFLANCQPTPAPAIAQATTAPTSVQTASEEPSGPTCTLPSGLKGNPSFDALARVDRSYVTITGRRLCNGAFGQRDADGQRITATIQFSAVGAGSDLSCLATFSAGFAVCTVPTVKVGRIGAEVPVIVSFSTGLFRTSYLSIE